MIINPLNPKTFLTDMIQHGKYYRKAYEPKDIEFCFGYLAEVIQEKAFECSCAQTVLILNDRHPEIGKRHAGLVDLARFVCPTKLDRPGYIDALWVRWFMLHDENVLREMIRIASGPHEQYAKLAKHTLMDVANRYKDVGRFLFKEFGFHETRGQQKQKGPSRGFWAG